MCPITDFDIITNGFSATTSYDKSNIKYAKKQDDTLVPSWLYLVTFYKLTKKNQGPIEKYYGWFIQCRYNEVQK